MILKILNQNIVLNQNIDGDNGATSCTIIYQTTNRGLAQVSGCVGTVTLRLTVPTG